MRRTSRAAPERSQSERETLLTKAELKQETWASVPRKPVKASPAAQEFWPFPPQNLLKPPEMR